MRIYVQFGGLLGVTQILTYFFNIFPDNEAQIIYLSLIEPAESRLSYEASEALKTHLELMSTKTLQQLDTPPVFL